MVGRLVEEEEIGGEEKESGQGRPHTPASRELRERAVDVVGSEAETAQNDLGLGLEPVPAQGLEAMLDLAVALGRRLARGWIGHETGQPLELGLEPPHFLEPG